MHTGITLDTTSDLTHSPWSYIQHVTILSILSPEIPCLLHLFINMVDIPTIQNINNTYRHQNKPTNILSFTYDKEPSSISGELILCPDVFISEAHQKNIRIEQHYAHLLVHGILHILGFDHENDQEAAFMEAQEIAWLHLLHFDNPYL